MVIEIDGKKYQVIIQRKIRNRNTYLRVKDDLKIYITTNLITGNKAIEKIIQKNIESIKKMIQKQARRKQKEEAFYYLGKKYDLIYANINGLSIGNSKIFLHRDFNLDKWLKKEAENRFQLRLDELYRLFPVKIPYPKLKIRKMTSRWGVCNTKTKAITLNVKLLTMNPQYLDYVIIHELAHLVYPNHSKEYWALVEKIVPNCKKLRKEMKE